MDLTVLFERFQHILMIDFLRYFVPSSLAFVLVWIILKERLAHRFIQAGRPEPSRLWSEFRYSMSTVVIFSTVGLCITIAKGQGYLHIYDQLSDYGLLYFFFSLATMIVFHDFYFYWTHRWMHHPKIFKHVHLVHHQSTNPSPWAAYSFHPIEAMIQALVLPIILISIPVHGLAIFIFLIYMILRNVWGHLGYELLPKKFIKAKWLNWNTTTTHHNMHHRYHTRNFGLYFTWWDKWMNTEHQAYKQSFSKVASKKASGSKRLIIWLLLLTTGTVLGQSPSGRWMTFNESTGAPLSIVSIQMNPVDQTYEGVIDSVIAPAYQGQNGRCMLCEGELKGQLLIGLKFLKNFRFSENEWIDGEIVDPESGSVYNSKIWFANDDSIMVRGYGGPFNLFYRTQIWRRKHGNGIEGTWETIDDRFNLVKAEVELMIENGTLNGYLRKIFLMPYEGNYPICTECQGAYKDKPIVGMKFMTNFESDKDAWANGTILDPGSGNNYSGKFWLFDPNTLIVRGYWGPFYRTQQWARYLGE